MPRYLLDTSALLAHYRHEAGMQAVQTLFEDREAEVVAASISITEFGRRLRDLGAPQAEVEEVLTYYQALLNKIIVIDADVAHVALTIAVITPKRLPLADALIVAAAQFASAVLVHRDEHMRHVPAGLVDQLDLEVKA